MDRMSDVRLIKHLETHRRRQVHFHPKAEKPKNKKRPVDDADELLEFVLSGLPFVIAGVGVATLQDGQLESLLELLSRP